MINIAICDDEIEIVKQIENIVRKNLENTNIKFRIHTFTDGQALTHSSCHFDLIFLDIEMPNTDGITAAKAIRQWDKEAKFVYVTSHSEYALKVFAVHPFDFAVKPINSQRIITVLNEYLEYSSRRKSDEEMITFKKASETVVLDLNDIIAFEYIDNRRITVYKSDGTDEISGGINEVLRLINSKGFASPHKSFIVNLREVKSIVGYDVIMSNELSIPVAQKRLKEFKETLSLYLHKKFMQE